MIFDHPGNAEKRKWNENRADVRQWEFVFGVLNPTVLFGKHVEDGIDARDEKPDCDEESKAGTEDLKCLLLRTQAATKV
jgi:hypothetical protein